MATLTLEQYDKILEALPQLYQQAKAERAKLAGGSAGTDDMPPSRQSRHNDDDAAAAAEEAQPWDPGMDETRNVGMDSAYFATAPGHHKDSLYGVRPAPERLGATPRGFDTEFPDVSRIRSV
jgi:hypothetical protein